MVVEVVVVFVVAVVVVVGFWWLVSADCIKRARAPPRARHAVSSFTLKTPTMVLSFGKPDGICCRAQK